MPAMTLAEFKTIYWWEWTHRAARAADRRGVPAAVPLVPLARLGRAGTARAAVDHLRAGRAARRGRLVDGGVRPHRAGERVAVPAGVSSHARLRDLSPRSSGRRSASCRASRSRRQRAFAPSAIALVVLVLLQIYLGALVAGLRAGLIYNTWPLIDGAFVPDAARLFFHAAVVAELLRERADRAVRSPHGGLCAAARRAWRMRSIVARHVDGALRGAQAAWCSPACSCCKLGLGILTLLQRVPIDLALAHQALAIVVLTIAVVHAAKLAPRRGRSRRRRTAGAGDMIEVTTSRRRRDPAAWYTARPTP